MITIIIPLDIKHMDDLIKGCNKPFIISPFAFKNNKKAISSTIEIFKKATNDIYIFDVTSLTCEVARMLNYTCIIKQYTSKSLYRTFEDGNFPNSFYSEVLEMCETDNENEFKDGETVAFKLYKKGEYYAGIKSGVDRRGYIIIKTGDQVFTIPPNFVEKYNMVNFYKTKVILQ